MSFIEIIIPPLKTSPEDRKGFLEAWERLSEIIRTAKESTASFCGFLLTEDDEDVSDNFKFAVMPVWKTMQDFDAFGISAEFKTFITVIKNFMTGPPDPQMYEMSGSPLESLQAPFTQVVRTRIESPSDEGKVQKAWEGFHAGAGGAGLIVHGPSSNLKEKLYLGVVGMAAQRTEDSAFDALIKNLKGIGSTSVLVVGLKPIEEKTN